MKKILILIITVFVFQNLQSQIKFRYGLTAGVNVSTAILPELKLNTNLNSILHGDDVVQGNPELADFVTLYKAGLFFRLDGGVGSAKFIISYTATDIVKEVKTIFTTTEILDINLTYLDFDFTYNLNIFKHFYFSLGYIPSLLLNHEGNLNVNNFDQRLLAGFGFKFGNGLTLDFDTVVGISEVIDGSYIHNVMIPVTISIPLNR